MIEGDGGRDYHSDTESMQTLVRKGRGILKRQQMEAEEAKKQAWDAETAQLKAEASQQENIVVPIEEYLRTHPPIYQRPRRRRHY